MYVVGNTAPMVWNFDNLGSHTDLQLTDPDGDKIYEVTLNVNPQKETDTTVKLWQLKKDISAFSQYQTTGLLENGHLQLVRRGNAKRDCARQHFAYRH